VIYGFQLHVMKSQLAEMKSGSADTHTLAVAADNQSKQAIEQTKKMGESLGKTDDLIKATNELGQQTKRYADAADRAIVATRSNFIRDQRPYMWFKPEQPKFEEGKPVYWSLHFVNYGRSPAYNVATCTILWYGQSPLKDVTDDTIASKCADVEGKKSTTFVIHPGSDIFSTAATNGIANGDALKILRDQDMTLVITGRIKYTDGYGNAYISKFCSTHLASGAAMACETNNEVK